MEQCQLHGFKDTGLPMLPNASYVMPAVLSFHMFDKYNKSFHSLQKSIVNYHAFKDTILPNAIILSLSFANAAFR